MIHIDKPDEFFTKMVKTCFPSYNGRKFKLSFDVPSNLSSYWDGGSKTSYVFYELATGKTWRLHVGKDAKILYEEKIDD